MKYILIALAAAILILILLLRFLDRKIDEVNRELEKNYREEEEEIQRRRGIAEDRD